MSSSHEPPESRMASPVPSPTHSVVRQPATAPQFEAGPVAGTGLGQGGSLTAIEILKLQRTIGNQAVSRLLGGPPSSGADQASAVIRRKRDIDAIDNEDLAEYLDDRDKKEVDKNYDDSLASGLKLRDKGLLWYTEDERAEPPVATSATEDKVARAGYKDFWFFDGDGETVTVSTTRGDAVADEASREVGGYVVNNKLNDDQDYFYSNSFNTKTGKFSASVNYREEDNKLAVEKSLPVAPSNSEMIWHQHTLAKRVAVGKGKQAHEVAPITKISREEISNERTLDTIFLCDEGGTAQDEEWVELTDPAQDDVWALLGTPNGNSAVWLLMQHGQEMGAGDIESVSYTKDSLKIPYLPK